MFITSSVILDLIILYAALNLNMFLWFWITLIYKHYKRMAIVKRSERLTNAIAEVLVMLEKEEDEEREMQLSAMLSKKTTN